MTASALPAQGRNRLDIDLSALHLAHREAVASPMAYSGAGLAGSLAYGRLAWHRRVRVALSAAMPTLESSLSSGSVPREDVARATLSLGALPVDANAGRFTIGPRLTADFTLRDYTPAGNSSSDFAYVFLHVGLGPEIARTWTIGERFLTSTLGVPLLGVVMRPYTDVRIVSANGARFQFVTPLALQAASLELTWAGRATQKAQWRLVYRGYLALYDPKTPYRALENSFGVRLAIGRPESPR